MANGCLIATDVANVSCIKVARGGGALKINTVSSIGNL